MFDISERDLFWLAGYLEGEGCFSVRHQPKGRKMHHGAHELKQDVLGFSIIAQTTDKDIAERAARIMRCTAMREVRDQRGNRKPAWIVCLGRRDDVRDLLTLLLPLMGDRRSAKIREMLHEIANRPAQQTVADRMAYMRKFRKPFDKTRLPPRLGGRWVKKSDLPPTLPTLQ